VRKNGQLTINIRNEMELSNSVALAASDEIEFIRQWVKDYDVDSPVFITVAGIVYHVIGRIHNGICDEVNSHKLSNNLVYTGLDAAKCAINQLKNLVSEIEIKIQKEEGSKDYADFINKEKLKHLH